MSDKDKLEKLQKALSKTADLGQVVTRRFQAQDATIKSLSKVVAIAAGLAGISTGGVIGIMAAPYAIQFIKSLF